MLISTLLGKARVVDIIQLGICIAQPGGLMVGWQAEK